MIHDDLSEVSVARLLAADNWQSKYRLITDWGRLIAPKPALRHRLALSPEMQIEGRRVDDVLDALLLKVEAPRQ